LKACTALWIVAPINRAVDDKTAKTLLGDSFKLQLKYDGTYSAVTFICSKTDDVSISEASESLDIKNEKSEPKDSLRDLDSAVERLRKKFRNLKSKRSAYSNAIEKIEDMIETWDDLGSKMDGGETFYAPFGKSTGKKRKRQAHSSKSYKKGGDRSDIGSDSGIPDSSISDDENTQPPEKQEPLTKAEINQTLATLKSTKKRKQEKIRALEKKISQVKDHMHEQQKEKVSLISDMKATCIKDRNDYSRRVIKQDFAMGMKEYAVICVSFGSVADYVQT
jgi:peptidoglycan hydrolase CwlO-like protein